MHDTQHAFASLLLSLRCMYVKEQLGPSSIQMTVDIYGHLIPSSNTWFQEATGSVSKPDTQPSATQKLPVQVHEA